MAGWALAWSRNVPTSELVWWLFSTTSLLGIIAALPGVVLLVLPGPLPVDSTVAAQVFAALAVGFFVGVLCANLVGKKWGADLRVVLSVSLLCVFIGFVVLSEVCGFLWLFVGWLVLGVAGGGSLFVVSVLLPHVLTGSYGITILRLMGLTLGGVGLIVTLFFYAATQRLINMSSVLLTVGILVLLWSVCVQRSRVLGDVRLTLQGWSLVRKAVVNPVTSILLVSIALQSVSHWAVIGWLPVYLTRGFGLSPSACLLVWACFWVSLSLARLFLSRQINSEVPFRWLGWSAAASLAGCLFLLQFQQVVVAMLGTLLLGVGLGFLHPVTLTLMGRFCRWNRPEFTHGVPLLWVIAGLPVSALIGLTVESVGIGAVLWVVLGSALFSFLLMVVVLLETRLCERTSPAL